MVSRKINQRFRRICLPSRSPDSSKPLIIWWSSSLSCGSSLTSVNVLYPEPNPSSDERIVGDDAIEEVELGSLECPRREKVGVVGEGRSDIVEEREG